MTQPHNAQLPKQTNSPRRHLATESHLCRVLVMVLEVCDDTGDWSLFLSPERCHIKHLICRVKLLNATRVRGIRVENLAVLGQEDTDALLLSIERIVQRGSGLNFFLIKVVVRDGGYRGVARRLEVVVERRSIG